MKKGLILVMIIALCFFSFGCSKKENEKTDYSEASITNVTESTTQKEITFDDYEFSAGANIANINEGKDSSTGKRSVILDTICPFCGHMNNAFVDADEVSDNIGKDSFVYSETVSCENWSNHSDTFTMDYTVSVNFYLQ